MGVHPSPPHARLQGRERRPRSLSPDAGVPRRLRKRRAVGAADEVAARIEGFVLRARRISVLASLLPVAALAQAPLPLPFPGPRTHEPQPTVAAITARDLMTRLYIFADDSMQGREAGTAGNVRGTDYIA